MIFWQLFIAFLEVGALAFGGGYAALPLIEQVVVNRYHWLSLREMTDVVAISQVTARSLLMPRFRRRTRRRYRGRHHRFCRRGIIKHYYSFGMVLVPRQAHHAIDRIEGLARGWAASSGWPPSPW